jgi:hypothetical protein
MRYYVYELVIMPDCKVCYVGKGQGTRMDDHLRRARRPDTKCGQKRLYRKLREVLGSGKSIVGRKVHETDSETDAFKTERETIQRYGFDNLFNVASHAFLGRSLKAEVRLEIAEASRRMWRDPEYRSKNHTVLGMKFAYRTKLALRKPKNYPIGKFGKGVSKWSAPGKSVRWQARISVNGKLKSLGYFVTPAGAACAYDDEFEMVYGRRPNSTQPAKISKN